MLSNSTLQSGAPNANTRSTQGEAEGSDQPSHWGKWIGRKHYSLEVIQQPIRGRMCGFGDKDHRPIAPAAIVKLVVQGDDERYLAVNEIDATFFLVMADLWSADGKQETNLVLHPSAEGRSTAPSPSRSSQRVSSGSSNQRAKSTAQSQPPSNGSFAAPITASPTQTGYQTQGSTPQPPPITASPTQTGYQTQGSTPQPPPITLHDQNHQNMTIPNNTSESQPTWQQGSPAHFDRSTGYPPPLLPSIHSLGRMTAPTDNSGGGPWGSELTSHRYNHSSYPTPNPGESSHHHNGHSNESSSHREPRLGSYNQADTPWPQHQAPMFSSGSQSHQQLSPVHDGHTTNYQTNFDNGTPISHVDPKKANQGHGPPQSTHPPKPSIPHTPFPTLPVSKHLYVRTLVGPLTANALQLNDEQGNPCILFIFQELAIRTEGTFRLRLRLLNIGAAPAPEHGARSVHNDVSSILAQVYTDQFIVYSAKRFPGVPNMTALSKALGKQGLKLPLRARTDPSKQNQRRARDDSEGSGAGSDVDGG